METPQVYQFGSDNNGWNNAWPLYAMNGGNGFLGGGLDGLRWQGRSY